MNKAKQKLETFVRQVVAQKKRCTLKMPSNPPPKKDALRRWKWLPEVKK